MSGVGVNESGSEWYHGAGGMWSDQPPARGEARLSGSLEPWQQAAKEHGGAGAAPREVSTSQAREAEADRRRTLTVLAAHSRGEFSELEDRQEVASQAPVQESLADIAARIYGQDSELTTVAKRVTGETEAEELDRIAQRIYGR